MDTSGGPARDAALVLTGVTLTDLAFRVSQVALPLLVLTGTGSTAATGVVAGVTGVPVLLSPWWARRLRHHLSDGRRLAACSLVGTGGQVVVATWATTHARAWWPLVVGGLVLGSAQALTDPGRDALVADLGDGLPGVDRAVGLLSARELGRRIGMVLGPVLGGLGVTAGHAVVLLWGEVGAGVAAAALVASVRPATPGPVGAGPPPRVRPLLRERPDVLAGWVVRGTGCLLWFSFTIGLTVLGVRQGRPGTVLAVGLTGYGAGSVAGALLTLPLLRRVAPLPAVATAWGVTGLAWVTIGLTTGTPSGTAVLAAAAATSGVGIAVGNAGVTAQVVRSSRGADRRALLAGQSALVQATGSLGSFVGGSVVGGVGPVATLGTAGVVLVVTAVVTPTLGRRRAPRATPPVAARSCAREGGS
ncbi:MFS transporter [Lapillicoccus jejuensis]|uniref:MFS family arabinose efflux permease n=1 Tax=Lapillicoccus jejuensis TaxID=402171 RepID=A0A542E362_9MICO|nr:MFS transporter [Lapillicoccus jejuensis]TQJ09674.1 hypothetical protein FB458_2787 [Lapillicoccus jejuensis]